MSGYSTLPEPKDFKRLEDIKTKSGSDINKAISLASSMANKITDRDKASRRKYAADKVFGEDSEISRVFQNRFNELNPNEIKRGELIDKILKAFNYNNTGSLSRDGVKIVFENNKIKYFERRQLPSHVLSKFAEEHNLPTMHEMWVNRHLFEPYDKTDDFQIETDNGVATEYTVFEFTL